MSTPGGLFGAKLDKIIALLERLIACHESTRKQPLVLLDTPSQPLAQTADRPEAGASS